MPKWTRAQRRRYQNELDAGAKTDVRDIFLPAKVIADRKRKAAKVAARLLGKKKAKPVWWS